MDIAQFRERVKHFIQANQLDKTIEQREGRMIATHSHHYNVAIIFTLSENYNEPLMEIRNVTKGLNITVSSGQLPFNHSNWREYAQHIGRMVKIHDANL